MREFSRHLTIDAPPGAVLDALVAADALAAWWNATRSLCVARPFGVYAVEWAPTAWEDEHFGRLGGVLHGTVIAFTPGRELFVADLFWLPPDGEPVGPMALEATCTPHGEGTQLHVRQSGWEDSARWSHYYDLIDVGFAQALDAMKQHVERTWRP